MSQSGYPMKCTSTHLLPLFLLSLATLSGCLGLLGCQRAPQSVNVELFVVSRNGENHRLGDVRISAVPYEQAVRSIQGTLAVRAKDLERLDQQIQQARANAAEQSTILHGFGTEVEESRTKVTSTARSLCAALNAAFTDLPDGSYKMGCFTLFGQYGPNGMTGTGQSIEFDEEQVNIINRILKEGEFMHNVSGEHQNSVASRLEDYLSARKKADEALNAYNQAGLSGNQPNIDAGQLERKREETNSNSAEHFFDDVSRPGIEATTDAEGKCSILLPPGQRWAICAHVKVGYTNCVWIVPFPSDQNQSVQSVAQTLVLSNNNMLRPGQTPLGMTSDAQAGNGQ